MEVAITCAIISAVSSITIAIIGIIDARIRKRADFVQKIQTELMLVQSKKTRAISDGLILIFELLKGAKINGNVEAFEQKIKDINEEEDVVIDKMLMSIMK